MRVLIVDDNEDNLRLLNLILKNDRHDVVEARNGREALDLARRRLPDLAISDILMPGMDGFALCRAWQEDPVLKEIPLVFYTATYTAAEDEAFALSLGARAFIRKPQEPNAFLTKVHEIMVGKKAARGPAPSRERLDDQAFLKLYNERLIHKLEQRADRLKASEERYRSLFERNLAGVYRNELGVGLVDCNDAFARMFGFASPEDAKRHPLGSFYVDAQELDRFRALLLEKGSVTAVETHCRRKDGSTFWVLENAAQLRDEETNRTFVEGTCFDISELKKAEEQHLLLSTAIEQGHDSVIVTDRDGIIIYVNPAFEKITGYGRQEATGRKPSFLKSGEHDDAFYHELWTTITGGRTWTGRFINRRKDGTRYTEDGTISPVRDAVGVITNFVAVKRDVTEQLALEAQFQQAQKMESVGRLAGGVAHDFNNMIGVIMTQAELGLLQTAAAPPLHARFEQIHKAAERSAALTRQLLAFSRKQAISPKVLDLNATVEGMLKMLRQLIGEDVEVRWAPFAGLWPVKMDPAQVDQILANLSANARDAIVGVGKVTIETGNVSFDEAYCGLHSGFVPGEWVLLAVSDSGAGMDRDILDHLFEPFFTTKAVGKGTGLGLATVYGIVMQNNGFIHVSSEPGAGTAFEIHLPRHSGEANDVEAKTQATIPRGGGETVLLVEDEVAVLRATTEMLSGLGYVVLAASSPGEALLLAEKHAEEIRLLITDVVMPELNGRELAERLQATNPRLKLVFMSGYTADVIAHRGVLEEGVQFIQKPFSLQGLATMMSEVLNRE